MARQTVKRLYDLEIDEISLVDRGANQHATVAIAKRDEDGSMGIYDADGYEVEENELEHGMIVYNDDGEEFIFVEDNPEDGTTDSLNEEHEEELVGVGKAAARPRNLKRYAVGAAEHLRRNRGAYIAGAGGAAAGAAGGRMSKSLGDSVYEELSKALNDDDRDAVIAKALGTVEIYKAQAEQAWDLAQALADERESEHFLEVAKGYQLPVQNEVLAEIMKSAAASMPAAHVETLDRIFSSVGEQLYAEVGANGGYSNSETMEMISALASQHVGKSDLSQEQAIVALFDANPDAYDTYIAEKG